MVHDQSEFLNALKKLMKARGVTYKVIAKRLSVSEITIKRFFTGAEAPWRRVFEVCDALDISFLEVAQLAAQNTADEHYLTEEQDRVFAENPGLYAFFVELLHGEKKDKLKKAWRLDNPGYFKALRKLERLGLIEILPNEKVKFLIKGTLRNRIESRLSKRVLKDQVQEFTDYVLSSSRSTDTFFATSELYLTKDTASRLRKELNEIADRYRKQATLEQKFVPIEKLTSHRWQLAMAPYISDWRKFGIKS